jgi:hypothetical protein
MSCLTNYITLTINFYPMSRGRQKSPQDKGNQRIRRSGPYPFPLRLSLFSLSFSWSALMHDCHQHISQSQPIPSMCTTNHTRQNVDLFPLIMFSRPHIKHLYDNPYTMSYIAYSCLASSPLLSPLLIFLRHIHNPTKPLSASRIPLQGNGVSVRLTLAFLVCLSLFDLAYVSTCCRESLKEAGGV